VTWAPRTNRKTRFPPSSSRATRSSTHAASCRKLCSLLTPSRLQILEPTTSPACAPITPLPVLHAFHCAAASRAEKLNPPLGKLVGASYQTLHAVEEVHWGPGVVPKLIIIIIVGGLLRCRRSHKKKHLQKIDTKPKLSIRELRSIFPDAPT
jgi:hypothetical protein